MSNVVAIKKETVRMYPIPTSEENQKLGIIRASNIKVDSRGGCAAERIVLRDMGDEYVVHRQFISHEGHPPCFSNGFYFSKGPLQRAAAEEFFNERRTHLGKTL